MYITLTLLSSLTYGFIHVSEPKNYLEAQIYCQNYYKSNLATIVTTNGKQKALSQINSSEQVWIGIYNAILFHDYNSYKSQNTEQESDCTIFDASSNNITNIHCNDHKPFLCDGAGEERKYATNNIKFGDWKSAETHCLNTYGTHLASIISDKDKENAINIIHRENKSYWVGIVLKDKISPIENNCMTFINYTDNEIKHLKINCSKGLNHALCNAPVNTNEISQKRSVMVMLSSISGFVLMCVIIIVIVLTLVTICAVIILYHCCLKSQIINKNYVNNGNYTRFKQNN
eukprot:491691_1